MKHRVFLFVVAFSLRFGCSAHEKSADELKELFTSEYKKYLPFTKIMNVQLGALEFTSNAETHFNGTTIAVNLDQINAYTKSKSRLFKTLFARFVIGHEIGHAFQYSIFQKQAFDDAIGERSIFLECHADIVSGILFTQVSTDDISYRSQIDPSFDAVKFNNESIGVMHEVLNSVMQMDMANQLIRNHPSNIQRLIAFRSGKIAANVDYTLALLAQENVPGMTQEKKLQQLNLYAKIGNALGFNPSLKIPSKGFLPTWSQYEALKIVNANNDLATGLIIFDRKYRWSGSGDNKTVNVSFKIKNTNDRIVRLQSRIFTDIIVKADPENLLWTYPIDGFEIDRFIKPGETVLIEGNCEGLEDATYTSEVVGPGNDRFIYSCSVIESNIPSNAIFKEMNTNFVDGNNASPDDIADWVFAINLQRNDLANLRKGIGLSSAREENELGETAIDYSGNFCQNKPDYFTVSFSDKRYSVEAYVECPNGEAALRLMQLVKNSLKDAIPGLQLQSETVSKIEFTIAEEKAVSLEVLDPALNSSTGLLVTVYGQ